MALPAVAILAGGLATRLYPATQQIPKSMIPVAGKFFIAHQLEFLKCQGVEEAVICTGFLGEQIRDYVQDGRTFGLRVKYSSDGEKLLGTGGALKKAVPYLGEMFFVLYGDAYLPADFSVIYKYFVSRSKSGLMTILRNENQWDKSNIICENGKILRYDKTIQDSKMCYIDFGLGLLRKSSLDSIAADQAADMQGIYQRLIAEDDILTWEVQERFYEIGSPKGLLETCAYLENRKKERGVSSDE